jgi:hypothetical protein
VKNVNNDLFDFLPSSNKKKFQIYTAEIGIEKVRLSIPLSESYKFKEEVQKIYPQTKEELKRVVEKFKGQIENEG